jgi:hypothetical protein
MGLKAPDALSPSTTLDTKPLQAEGDRRPRLRLPSTARESAGLKEMGRALEAIKDDLSRFGSAENPSN